MRTTVIAAVLGLSLPLTLAYAAQQAEGTWTKAAPMSGVQSELQAVAVGGKVYAIGGNVVGTRDGKMDLLPDTGFSQVYDPATNSWRPIAPVPKGANHTGIAALNGKIYIGGGFTGRGHTQSTNGFFVYDPATDRWQELAPMLSPRGAPALVALNGKIHAISGRILNADGAVPAHEIYDPATNRWTAAAPLPVARDHVGIAVVDGKIHIYGGRRTDAVKSKVGLHHVYDPAVDRWTEAAPMPVPVSSGTYAQYRGLLLYLGGECTDDDKTMSEVQAYDPKTNSWRLLAPLPMARHAQAAAVTADKVYMIGGSTGCGPAGILTDNLVFSLP